MPIQFNSGLYVVLVKYYHKSSVYCYNVPNLRDVIVVTTGKGATALTNIRTYVHASIDNILPMIWGYEVAAKICKPVMLCNFHKNYDLVAKTCCMVIAFALVGSSQLALNL